MATFDFPVRFRGDLVGVGNSVADPLQGLYILGSLCWETDQMIVHFLVDCGPPPLYYMSKSFYRFLNLSDRPYNKK